MKFFDMNLDFAPNPRRVLIYLVEKRIQLDREIVDAREFAHKSQAFLRNNPAGRLPALKLSSGEVIRDSGAIVEFIEEIHPEPNMIGASQEERAQVRSLERMTVDWLWLTAVILRNNHKFFTDWGVPQNPAAVAYAQPRFEQLATAIDSLIGKGTFAVGKRVTIADCTLCAAFDFAYDFGQLELREELANLRRWNLKFSQRPSASVDFKNYDRLLSQSINPKGKVT